MKNCQNKYEYTDLELSRSEEQLGHSNFDGNVP